MKANIEIPVILEDQQKVVNWSRKLKAKYIDFSSIIEYLVSNKKTNSEIINNGLAEMRTIYQKYNSDWRKQLLITLMIDNYRLENDIRNNDVVSNGEYIGYAFYIDYKTRKFKLYSSQYKEESLIGTFQMDDFASVV